MEIKQLLNTITELSHAFGAPLYVRGGGGNTSAKTDTTLWVKPSGMTLATIKPSDFVGMDRAKLAKLFEVEPPKEPAAREALVKTMMEQAVLPEYPGRASVEAPLHSTLSARYVVHTHPAWVNGMTCGKNGKTACATLFPQALWIDYIDPGYTLCMQVRKEIQDYKRTHRREPSLIFLKNHGVFVAADTPEEIRSLYAGIHTALTSHYNSKGIPAELPKGAMPNKAAVAAAEEKIRAALGDASVHLAVGGLFHLANGPVSPDHIVYSKSYYLVETPTADNVAKFTKRHGYRPYVIAFDGMVFGVGASAKQAGLALELAQDAAEVVQLTAAFGGIEYMTDRAREFIENWEVESYRSKQIS